MEHLIFTDDRLNLTRGVFRIMGIDDVVIDEDEAIGPSLVIDKQNYAIVVNPENNEQFMPMYLHRCHATYYEDGVEEYMDLTKEYVDFFTAVEEVLMSIVKSQMANARECYELRHLEKQDLPF